MKPGPASTPPSSRQESAARFWAVAVLVAAILAAYANSFRGPLVFDDTAAITENDSLSSLRSALHPPSHRTVSGRPVANVTFALNHLVGGEATPGYHVVNLLIHLGAALTLYGLVRRTLLRPALAARFGASSRLLALTVAAMWALHPLQTESVTYIVQRVESLMGLFYLLTLYAFVRGAGGQTVSRRWLVLSVAACLLGMGTKEVMCSAPLMVLLYDRMFVAGTFSAAWRARRPYYCALAVSWLWLGWLVLQAGQRNGSVGYATGVSPWLYAVTQCHAVVHYLRLVLWPRPLVFDYGTALVHDPVTVLPQALLLAALGLASAWAVWRNRPAGFLGVFFFAILAPSSSILPVITQSMAEHRMYLPLAAAVILLVLGTYARWGRRSLAVWAVVAAGWGGATFARNADYRTDTGLWRDTIAKLPSNPRAYDALGNALADAGRPEQAVVAFREALRVAPDYVESRNNLGVLLAKLDRPAEAIRAFEAALKFNPAYATAHFNLANTLVEAGRPAEARPHYLETLRLNPGQPDVLLRLADLELKSRDFLAAEEHYRAVLAATPQCLPAHFSLAFALVNQGRLTDAIAEMRATVELAPDQPMAHYNLGNALVQAQQLPEAAAAYRRALELDPGLVAAHFNLGNTYALLTRYPEAIREYEAVLSLDPAHPAAKIHLAEARRLAALGP